MNTALKLVYPKPVVVNEEFEQQRTKDLTVLDMIDNFIQRDAPEYIWANLPEHISWTEISPETVRTIALRVYNHPSGCVLLHRILQLNVLHFEDFGEMSADWTNYDYWLTWAVLHKVHEVAKFCDKVHDGRIIASAIANAGRNGKESWCAIRYAHY